MFLKTDKNRKKEKNHENQWKSQYGAITWKVEQAWLIEVCPRCTKLGRPKKDWGDWDPSNISHLNHMFAVVSHSYEVILTNS